MKRSLLLLLLSPAFAADEASSPNIAPESTRKARVLQPDARGCTWIESEGLITVGQDESRSQVRASAINEARQSGGTDAGARWKSA